MNNSKPFAETFNGHSSFLTNIYPLGVNVQVPNLTNKYVYVKQNLLSSSQEQKTVIPKVLVNPHFNKKVFVNPNFNINSVLPSTSVPKIHVNPNVQKLNLNNNVDCSNVKKIHINPNVLRNLPVSLNNVSTNYTGNIKENQESMKDFNHEVTSTISQFVSSPMKIIPTETEPRKRRSSLKSKFKIIKSSILQNPVETGNGRKRRTSILSKYKIVKSTYCKQNYTPNFSKSLRPLFSKFKLDNRSNKTPIKATPHKGKKYVYVNRFLSISDLARNSLLKQSPKLTKSGIINANGILYKNSPNCLKRISSSFKKPNNVKDTVCKSKYKFVRRSMNKIGKEDDKKCMKQPKQSVILSTSKKTKKNLSPGKLRKCNIPCPFYRKFGRCKAKDSGKCFRKHDPDQIALCTKFLQGACVNKKCLLSHNVSAEKMPTCKFYLEGSCSRDDCPYLHVRLNPKADVCRDFLEGFCKKAAECDKRHQFLCPDYEKSGSCLKQRCPYPHGKMVRKYSVFNKNKFAKKSSNCKNEVKSNLKNNESDTINKNILCSKHENFITNSDAKLSTRYYVEQNVVHEENFSEVSNNDQKISNNATNCDQETVPRSRSKLGDLPSFIAFEEVQ